MPQALMDMPDLMLGLDIYVIAYNELQADRPIGMDVGPVPWSAIHRWGDFHGITDPDDLETLVHHIRAMEVCDRNLESQGKTGK